LAEKFPFPFQVSLQFKESRPWIHSIIVTIIIIGEHAIIDHFISSAHATIMHSIIFATAIIIVIRFTIIINTIDAAINECGN
jgi:hypothetical protein